MKRKYIHRTKRQIKFPPLLTLGDGIPALRRTISETGPSIPSDEEHLPVMFTEAPFGLLSEEDWEEMIHIPSRLFPNRDGHLIYSSEKDVAGFVKSFVSAILQAIGLDTEVEIHSEVGTFNVRHDLCVVTGAGMPVGVIKVKKPDVSGKPSGMSHPNVLGELCDFLKHLPNFYGVSPCFGILTNMNSWRIAWIPDQADTVAAEEERLCDGSESNVDDDEEDPAIKRQTYLHFIMEDNEDLDETQSDEVDTSTRHCHVSQVFDKSDASTLVRAITSAIMKMLRCDVKPFSSPFDRLAERTILKFVKGSSTAFFWTRLNVEPKWDSVAKPKKFLFAIEDLGRGSDGRVWLTSSSSGAVCVLKFTLSNNLSDTMKEKKSWNKAYPGIPVHAEIWCGHPALRMPYFCREFSDKNVALSLVRNCLLTNFAEKGLVHGDVEWRNIGFFKTVSGEEAAIVFDLTSVQNMKNREDFSWVDEACQELKLGREEE